VALMRAIIEPRRVRVLVMLRLPSGIPTTV